MTATRLYIGNIPFNATRQDVENFFHPRKVVDVKFITDRDTGQPRGFGFVEMESEEAAREAVETLDDMEMGGRRIKVSIAEGKKPGGGGPRRGERDNRGGGSPRGNSDGRGNGRGRDRDWDS